MLLYATYFYKLPNPKIRSTEILSRLDMFLKSGSWKCRYFVYMISKSTLKLQCETKFSLFIYYVSVCYSRQWFKTMKCICHKGILLIQRNW